MITLLQGRSTEKKAEQFLKKNGLQLLYRNYYCRLGEIDLIMLDQQDLVFVEVRYRQDAYRGSAIESVDVHKQRKLIKAAKYFLSKEPQYTYANCRFDVVACEGDTHKFNWVKNAFME